MEIILIIIVFLIGILASILINHIFPYLTLPLIQIIIGFIIGLTPLGHDLQLGQETIMVLIIAPLLFYEAQKANTIQLYKNLKSILVIAFPMVIITVVLLGFFFGFALPFVPLAASFALAASLAPTDMVTVSSLSKRMHIPKRNKILLEGEGLINDASGITTFQIAVLALVSGSFSVLNAFSTLLYISLGGVIIGIIVEFLKNKIVDFIRLNGIEDINFFIILQILLPFFTYVIAEFIGVSGVLAVVTVGLFEAMSIKKNTLFDAKVKDLSNSTWKVINTVLNAIVFLYLGDRLPTILEEVNALNNSGILKYILVIIIATFMLFLIRFLLLIIYKIYKDGIKRSIKIKDQIILTLAGVKGTVTLATITSLPFFLYNDTRFEERSLIIFIAAGVIILTIVTAITILPIILDKIEEKSTTDMEIKIAQKTIELLQQERDQENVDEVNDIIRIYYGRIRKLKMEKNNLNINKQIRLEREILKKSIKIEQEQLDELLQNEEIGDEIYVAYARLLKAFSRKNNRKVASRITIGTLFLRRFFIHRKHPEREHDNIFEKFSTIKEIYIHNHYLVIEMIKNLENEENSNFIHAKILEEERTLKLISEDKLPTIMNINLKPKYNGVMAKAFQYERNIVQDLFERGEIDHEDSVKFKQDVSLMEKYYLSDNADNLTYYFINKMKENIK